MLAQRKPVKPFQLTALLKPGVSYGNVYSARGSAGSGICSRRIVVSVAGKAMRPVAVHDKAYGFESPDSYVDRHVYYHVDNWFDDSGLVDMATGNSVDVARGCGLACH